MLSRSGRLGYVGSRLARLNFTRVPPNLHLHPLCLPLVGLVQVRSLEPGHFFSQSPRRYPARLESPRPPSPARAGVVSTSPALAGQSALQRSHGIGWPEVVSHSWMTWQADVAARMEVGVGIARRFYARACASLSPQAYAAGFQALRGKPAGTRPLRHQGSLWRSDGLQSRCA